MRPKRRYLLKLSVFIATTVLGIQRGLARLQIFSPRPRQAFAADTMDKALQALFGDRPLTESDKIFIDMYDLAEDGAIVPIKLSVDLPDIQRIYLLSDKNPVPLIARFEFTAHVPGSLLGARVKMATSGHVIVVAENNQGLFSARRFIEVTVGGCD